MDINDIPRGQLSTIILTSLLNGDKYGYEIINEVEEKTNGELVIKKPSLYSALSRMENQDLVSSYWKDSEIGGRRHYYRLTDYGRKQVLQWQEDLITSQNKVSKILSEPKSEQTTLSKQENSIQTLSNNENNETTVAHQENLFGMIKNKDIKKEEAIFTENKKDVFLQYDLFDTNFISTPAEDDAKPKDNQQEQQISVFNVSAFVKDENKSDIKENQIENLEQISSTQTRIEDKLDNSKDYSFSTPKVEIGNFDIENELSKYKKEVKSYTDEATEIKSKRHDNYDYISPAVIFNDDPSSNDDTISDNSVNDLENNIELQQTNEIAENKEEKPKSDAVYITDVLNEEDFKVKKIEPASFSHLGQTHVIKKVQEQKNNNNNIEQISASTYYEDYNSLKKYFKKMDINLKVYGEKEDLQTNINPSIKINKFKFFSYLIFFVLSGLEIITSYFVLSHLNLLATNHKYYLIAYAVVNLIPLIYYSFKFIKYSKKTVDKTNVKVNPLWFKLCIILLSAGIIYCLNSIFGMNLVNFKYYITTSILPFCIILNSLFVHLFKFLYLRKK